MPTADRAGDSVAGDIAVEVPGKGACRLPGEFVVFTGAVAGMERLDARISPRIVLGKLASGTGVVLHGSYPYVDAVMRYCQRNENDLVSPADYAGITDRRERAAACTRERRRRLHLLFVVARGALLEDVTDDPFDGKFTEWLAQPVGAERILVPVRRLQRILTDMTRAREGIPMDFLGGSITILPHVYVPSDLSVPGMFLDHAGLFPGKSVLDMGTGTGVLALLAVRLGAAKVVATDSNPMAVKNVRINAERLGLAGRIDVRGPAGLFGAVPADLFDVVMFNVPWIEGEPLTLYDTANYDPGRTVIGGFLREVSVHLAPGGVILLQCSDISAREGGEGLAWLRDLIGDAGFRTVVDAGIGRRSRVTGTRERVHLMKLVRADTGC